MKKTALLVAFMLLTTLSVSADTEYYASTTNQPLILAPLSTVLSSSPATYSETTTERAVAPLQQGVYEASYVPVSQTQQYAQNMIPQNAAAKGEPVPQQAEPRVRIQTKQRSQGNAYWNAGGKGTKSFF